MVVRQNKEVFVGFVSKCVNCGFRVGSGGDRHRVGFCPPKSGIYGEHRRRKLLAARARQQQEVAIRGVTVAGTGKPSASSKGGARKKAADLA